MSALGEATRLLLFSNLFHFLIVVVNVVGLSEAASSATTTASSRIVEDSAATLLLYASARLPDFSLLSLMHVETVAKVGLSKYAFGMGEFFEQSLPWEKFSALSLLVFFPAEPFSDDDDGVLMFNCQRVYGCYCYFLG